MTVDEIDMDALMDRICGVVTETVFKGVEPGLSAREFVERGELVGLIFGRITAAIISINGNQDDLHALMERSVETVTEQVLTNMRAAMRPKPA